MLHEFAIGPPYWVGGDIHRAPFRRTYHLGCSVAGLGGDKFLLRALMQERVYIETPRHVEVVLSRRARPSSSTSNIPPPASSDLLPSFATDSPPFP